jgi:hypothetical protein
MTVTFTSQRPDGSTPVHTVACKTVDINTRAKEITVHLDSRITPMAVSLRLGPGPIAVEP